MTLNNKAQIYSVNAASTKRLCSVFLYVSFWVSLQHTSVRLDTLLLGCTRRQITSFWLVARSCGEICRSWIIWRKRCSVLNLDLSLKTLSRLNLTIRGFNRTCLSVGLPAYCLLVFCCSDGVSSEVCICESVGSWPLIRVWMHALEKAGKEFFVCVELVKRITFM